MEFQGVIKSLYIQVFRKVHVLNDILSLEFACVVVAKNKDIRVNWATYAYLTYRKLRSFEIVRKIRHENLLQLQDCPLQAQQNGGVIALHVATRFGLQGKSTTTSLTSGVTLPFRILSLRLPHPPFNLAPHRHPIMRAPKTLKSGRFIIQKSCCIHNEELHSFANHNSMTICH